MAAEIIDGNAVAALVRERVAAELDELSSEHGVRPGLATVLVGEDPASEVYVRMKREDSAKVGIDSYHHEPDAEIRAEELATLVASLNADERIHGILLQLPLPGHLDDAAMTALIDPAKDVDGLHPMNAGLLVQAREGLVPCTPAGVMELLRHAG